MLMEKKGFRNKLSAIITAVSLVIVLVGTGMGSLKPKGEVSAIQEASGYEIGGIEVVELEAE